MNPAKPKLPRGRPAKRDKAHIDEIKRTLAINQTQAEKIAKRIEEGASLKDIEEARLHKLKLECARLENLLNIEAGLYVLTEEVAEEGRALGVSIKASLLSWVGSLPGRLEGLTAAQMVPIFEREVDRVCEILSSK